MKTMTREATVKANGVELCTESFGKRSDPALLLIMGASSSMLWWEEGFCERLAEGGRYVIRYDNRDTGQSVTYEPGKPQYAFEDLVEDARGVLDAYGIEGAHLVGMSLGGMIAQVNAIRHPDRVLTLTLISTSPHGPEDPDLPPMDETILEQFQAAALPDWNSETAVIDYMVKGRRLLVGKGRAFDEARIRRIAGRDYKRMKNPAAMLNHAVIPSRRWREQLRQVKAPTLVIHGSDDPVLPYGHGAALAREIPGARLLTLEGAGHEVHPADWDTVVSAVLQHTALR